MTPPAASRRKSLRIRIIEGGAAACLCKTRAWRPQLRPSWIRDTSDPDRRCEYFAPTPRAGNAGDRESDSLIANVIDVHRARSTEEERGCAEVDISNAAGWAGRGSQRRIEDGGRMGRAGKPGPDNRLTRTAREPSLDVNRQSSER